MMCWQRRIYFNGEKIFVYRAGLRGMIHAVLRVTIKYVFGSCTFVEFVVPRVASCAFMWAERLLPFGEEKKSMQGCRWVRVFSRWMRIS